MRASRQLRTSRRWVPNRVSVAAVVVALLVANCGGGGGGDLGTDVVNFFANAFAPERTAVAFGAGRFVSVGKLFIEASDSGTGFTPVVGSDGQTIDDGVGYGVTYGAHGWLATNGFVSPDGTVWSPITIPTTATVYGAAFGAGSYALVGAGGTVLVSSDAQSWQAVDSGTNRDLLGIDYTNGQFVVVGRKGTILTSAGG